MFELQIYFEVKSQHDLFITVGNETREELMMTPRRVKLEKSRFVDGRSKVQVWATFEMDIQYPGGDVK